MHDGLLLIDKEAGITSYDVIRRLKRVFPKGQKIGHAGTLDPFATGLLIIMLGRATKLNDQLHQMKKSYVATAQFGFETDTQDITGQPISHDENLMKLDEGKIRSASMRFVGEILQIPPAYSAKKVAGKRSYDLAREGKAVQLQAKLVTVYRFELTGMQWPDATFEIEVSTGTYIRTLIADLGRTLGTFATCTALRRTAIGSYTLEQSVKSDQINDEIYNEILPLRL